MSSRDFAIQFVCCASCSKVLEFFIVIVTHSLSAGLVVDLCDDGVADVLEFLHLLSELVLVSVFGVRVQPVLCLVERVGDSLLLVFVKLVSELLLVLNCVAHLVDVVLQLVLGVNALLDFLILVSKLLCVCNHLFDFLLGQAALVVGD